MNLIVDIGNTQTKILVFDLNGNISFQDAVKSEDFIFEKSLIEKYEVENCIMSSVKKHSISMESSIFDNFIYLTNDTEIPLTNKYKKPEHLGMDRLALSVAANLYFKNQDCLVIDAGTCITYDFVSKNNEYLGGAISPGVTMRLDTLHDHTDKLPLIKYNEIESAPLIGKNTKESIISGVINATAFEMDGFIESYKEKYSSLKVLLTGGNMNLFEKAIKNHIFADENLLAKGLNRILNYNIEK